MASKDDESSLDVAVDDQVIKTLTDEKRPRSRSAREVDIIRQDRAMHLVPGMFVLGGDATSPRMSAVQFIQNVELTFRFNQMSGYDLRVLHGLAAMCMGQIRGQVLSYSADDFTDEATKAWGELQEDGKARGFGRYITTLRTSKRQLSEIITSGGSVNGQSLELVYESLKRLAEVTIHMKSVCGKYEYTTHLLSVARNVDTIMIGLNPRIVAAVSLREGGSFSTISMHDIRKLKAESPVLLLSRLCGFIDEGDTRNIGQDKLEGYIWGNVLPATQAQARRDRLKKIRKAVNELKGIGWDTVEHEVPRGARATFSLTRPVSREKHVQTVLPLLPQELP